MVPSRKPEEWVNGADDRMHSVLCLSYISRLNLTAGYADSADEIACLIKALVSPFTCKVKGFLFGMS